MLNVNLFRFDVKIDILSYYKPYLYDNKQETTLKNMLLKLQEKDPYFSFDGVKFVKINNYIVDINENLTEIENFFGKDLKISPLSEKRATKDLIFNDDDFKDKFYIFRDFTNEIATYNKFKPAFYSSFINEYSDNFFGNSGFLFAYFLCQKYSENKKQILEIVKRNIPYLVEYNFFKDPFEMQKCIDFFKKELSLNFSHSPNQIDALDIKEHFIKNDFKYNFSNFNISVFNDKEFEELLKKIGAKIIKFDTSEREITRLLFEFDKECALKIASDIIFDAFDSGSDFLIVNHEFDFEIFDKNIKKLESIANRSLEGFYILRGQEFLQLANGQIPNTLKNHVAKPTLVDF